VGFYTFSDDDDTNTDFRGFSDFVCFETDIIFNVS
jgi:hypothetical protein